MERTSDKQRRPKCPTEQPILPIARYRDDAENIRTVDNCWKYYQSNKINASNGRNERRQSNPAIDYNKDYYNRTDVPRTSRKHGMSNSSRIKYVVPQSQEEFQNVDDKNQSTLKLPRNQTFRQYVNNGKYTKNFAVVRKNQCVDDFDDSQELENSTFNESVNVADETSEEVGDEEHLEHLAELNEKDYQEHEADDEIDEEPDVLDRSLDKSRIYRQIRVEPLPRNHKISSAPSASRYHHPVGKHSDRCCHSAANRKPGEIPTEEEEEEEFEVRGLPPYCTQKRSSFPSRQRNENAWVAGRKLSERYSDLPERSLLAENRQSRRPKSMRPGMEKAGKSRPQSESICNTKCDRCGRTSKQTPRTTSSRNATCRLQDSQYFMGKSNGDEIFEEPTRDSLNGQTTLRRSRESRSPIYECNERSLATDYDDDDDDDDKNHIGVNSKVWAGKNSREITNLRRALGRADDRHEDKTTSKTNKGYWAER